VFRNDLVANKNLAIMKKNYCLLFFVLFLVPVQARAVYMTFSNACQSLTEYGMPYSGVIISQQTVSLGGYTYNVYGAITSGGKCVVGIKSNKTISSYFSHLFYATGTTAVMTPEAVATQVTGNYIEVPLGNWYFFMCASSADYRYQPWSSVYTIKFPDTLPALTDALDVDPSTNPTGSVSVLAYGVSDGTGITYTQVQVDGEWVTVQVQPAPTSNTSYSYSISDVQTWLGSTEGVTACRVVTTSSTGTVLYTSQGTFTGTSTYIYDDGINTITSVPSVSTTYGLSTQSEGTLSYNENGVLSYGVNGTGEVTTNSTTVSVVGTASDALTAANTQTGIQRQTLAAVASSNTSLSELNESVESIAEDVDTIADSSGSSSSAGGLTDEENAFLENIDKNVQDSVDRQAAWDEMTGYDREDSMADVISDAANAVLSAASVAQESATNALSSQGLEGSDQSAGNTAPSGSSNFWTLNLPWGAQLNFDPADVYEIATILYAIRAALGWIFLGWFFQWFVPRLREAYQTLILTPTPVANTNPAGLIGGVTNATKVVIWVAVLVAIPSIVSGILDTSAAISGFSGMVSWRDTNPIQEISAASTPLGAAVKLVGCVMPLATMMNLFVLYVTAELFMNTFVYLLIFANKHITSY